MPKLTKRANRDARTDVQTLILENKITELDEFVMIRILSDPMLKWSVNNIKTDGMVDTPNSPVHQITISGKN